jgi:hypothetical protein
MHCVVPQSVAAPQLSITVPHLPLQVVACELRVQPHMLGVPPPPQVTPVPVHCAMPQSVATPQLSITVPHLPPLQVVACELRVQPQMLPLQIWPDPGQVVGPQVSVPPQPSLMVPQFVPAGQAVSGVQPHWLGVPPPPQVRGAAH